jgi:hypothetical protein
VSRDTPRGEIYRATGEKGAICCASRISSPAAATLTAAAIIPKLALYNPQALCRGDESLVPRSEIRNLNSKIACLPRHPVC